MIRVADYIASHLKQIGIDKIFLVSGGGIMHLVDAIGKMGMPYQCGHHEQACGMAAEGYARRSGKLGVCYATSGPGGTNTLTALVGAWQDSSPVLFITGQSKRSQTIRLAKVAGLRQFGTFEVDILPMVMSVTKYAHFLDDPLSVRYQLEKAIHLATSGRPGPVLLDIPLDVQGALIDPDTLPGFEPEEIVPKPTEEGIAFVLEKLRSAARPILLVGHGVRCAKSIPALRTLVDRLGVPVVATQLAKDALPYDHPLFVGHSGPKGDRAGNFALQAADVILSLGCSLNAQSIGWEVDLYAPRSYKIQVDIDKPILQRGDVPVDLQIEADVTEFLAAMLASSSEAIANKEWPQRCEHWKHRFAVSREPHDFSTPEINFYEFAEVLSNTLLGDESIVTDAGSAFYVMGQAFKCKANQRYIVSGAMGAMGYALPAAIGCAAADKSRPVVCVTGDGSLQMNIQELQTLKHYNLNVKLFVINNEGYASIRNTQKGFFHGQYVGASNDSGVTMPCLEKIVAAYDLAYIAIDNRATLAEQIAKALQTLGPVVVGIKAQPGQVILPATASVKLADGRMRSNPLQKMSPELPPEVFAEEFESCFSVPVE